MRASAHGARVRERPRRMASHSLGWVSGWARTARVGRIQLPAHACACERSTARASLERPARVEGRPRAHPRATEAWRTGCGVAKGWAQKRAHRGGRARAEEVCTRVTWPFCRRLPGAPGRRPLMRDVIAPSERLNVSAPGMVHAQNVPGRHLQSPLCRCFKVGDLVEAIVSDGCWSPAGHGHTRGHVLVQYEKEQA